MLVDADLTEVATSAFRDVAAHNAFWRSIGDPEAFRTRLTDHRRVAGYEIRRAVEFSYDVEQSEQDSGHDVVFLRPANGRVVEGVSVNSATGRQLGILNDDQCLQLFAEATAFRLNLLRTNAGLNGGWAPETLVKLLELVGSERRDRLERDAIDKREGEVERLALQAIGAARITFSDLAHVRNIAGTTAVAAVRDLLACRIPPHEGGLVKYEMRELLNQGGSLLAVQSRLASAVGGVPRSITVPLYKAGKCASYTLEVDVGDGNYVRSIELDGGDLSSLETSGRGTSVAVVVARRGVNQRQNAVIKVDEHPSKTLLSSFLLCLATGGAVIAGRLLNSKIQPWTAGQIGLGELAGGLSVGAVGLAAIRNVVAQSTTGRVLPIAALNSAMVSALVLCGLSTGLLLPRGEARNWLLTVLLLVGILHLAVAGAVFFKHLKTLSLLRAKTAEHHPASPSTG